MRQIPTSLVRLAGLQGGLVSKRQCLASGLPPGAPARLVKLGRWQRARPGVYVTHTGKLDDRAKIWAALLAVGNDAIACHRTSVWLAVPNGPLPMPIHIAVPIERALRQNFPGVVIHRLEITSYSGAPPRMRLARSLLDAVNDETDPRKVIGLVCDVVASGKTESQAISRVMKKRRAQRWRALLNQMLADVAIGAESPLEIADLRNDTRHGLPRAERQVTRRVSGQAQRVDVVVHAPGVTTAVIKELDGRLGHAGAGRFRDMIRDNVTVLRGGLPLRFGWVDIVIEGCESAAWQALLHRRLGWSGTPTPCGVACTFVADLDRLDREHPWNEGTEREPLVDADA